MLDKSARIFSSSGKKDMDAAAPSAIRTAAPSATLTEGYATTTLDLQFSFYNNSEPQEPPQKPKVVPVGTAQALSERHVYEPGLARQGVRSCSSPNSATAESPPCIL